VRAGAVARNYAEALLDLGLRHDAVTQYGGYLDAVAGAVSSEPLFDAVLASPRVPRESKKRLLRDALGPQAPAPFVRFLEAVVHRGRQGLFREMSHAYEDLVDVHLNRVHAGVTTAHALDADLAEHLTAALSRMAGRKVMPHFRIDPALLGGLVVRMGDQVWDGSLRRRLRTLRYRMLHARAERGA